MKSKASADFPAEAFNRRLLLCCRIHSSTYCLKRFQEFNQRVLVVVRHLLEPRE